MASQLGHAEFAKAQLSSTALSLADALIPGLLGIAREFPIVGPLAGVALMFHRNLKSASANQAEFARLKEQVDLALSWCREVSRG